MIKLPKVFIGTFTALGILILYVPILIVIIYSFNEADRSMIWQGFSLRWFYEVWKDQNLINSLYNSLYVAFLAALISFCVGFLAGYILSISEKYLFILFSTILFLPLLIPDLLISLSNAFLYKWLGFEKGILSIALSISVVGSSYIALFVSIRLRSIDFRTYVKAASSLGASFTQIFFTHYSKLSIKVALIGVGIVILLSVQDFLYAFFCGSNGTTTFAVHIYSLVRFGPNGGINVIYSLFIILIVIILIINSNIKSKGAEI